MSIICSSKVVKFNQALHFEDIKAGGNCYAYNVLFLNYLIAHRFLFGDQNISYNGLTKMLNKYKDKTELQNSQNHHPSYYLSDILSRPVCVADTACGYNDEVMLLHKSSKGEGNADLGVVLAPILQDLENQEIGNSYTIDLHSDQSFLGMPLFHTVSLYLASSNELHFFDANSGVHVIRLPKEVNIMDLKETVSNLIFKQNFIIKHAFDPTHNDIEYVLIKSKMDNTHPLNEVINNYLNKSNSIEAINATSTLNDVEKKFLQRIFFAINIQRKGDKENRSEFFVSFANFFKNVSPKHHIQHIKENLNMAMNKTK